MIELQGLDFDDLLWIADAVRVSREAEISSAVSDKHSAWADLERKISEELNRLEAGDWGRRCKRAAMVLLSGRPIEIVRLIRRFTLEELDALEKYFEESAHPERVLNKFRAFIREQGGKSEG